MGLRLLTLLVLPVVYPWFSPREVKAPEPELVGK